MLALVAPIVGRPVDAVQADDELPVLKEIEVESSQDGTLQPSRVWAPESAVDSRTPLLVSLHTWSSDYRQDRSRWLAEAASRGWIYIQPNFRGRNDHPEACGSHLAQHDVLDALDWCLAEYEVDTERIYLAGVSGGGHMTMLMAGRYPAMWAAASAWVGISDLAAWHRKHAGDRNGRPTRRR